MWTNEEELKQLISPEWVENPPFPQCFHEEMEARPGFEPGIKDLQSSALPLGHRA